MENSPYTEVTLEVFETLWQQELPQHRRGAAGVPVPHGAGRAADERAGRARPAGQGRVQGTGGGRVSEEGRRRRRLRPPDAAAARRGHLPGDRHARSGDDRRRRARYAPSAASRSDRFEFQMLYGIRRDLQASLVAEGYRMRIYIPFGRSGSRISCAAWANGRPTSRFVLKSSSASADDDRSAGIRIRLCRTVRLASRCHALFSPSGISFSLRTAVSADTSSLAAGWRRGVLPGAHGRQEAVSLDGSEDYDIVLQLALLLKWSGCRSTLSPGNGTVGRQTSWGPERGTRQWLRTRSSIGRWRNRRRPPVFCRAIGGTGAAVHLRPSRPRRAAAFRAGPHVAAVHVVRPRDAGLGRERPARIATTLARKARVVRCRSCGTAARA